MRALRPEGHEDTQCVLSFTKHFSKEQTFSQCEARFTGWARQGKEYRVLFLPVSEVKGQFPGVVKSRSALLEYGERKEELGRGEAWHREGGSGGSKSQMFRRNAHPVRNCEATQTPKTCLPDFSARHLPLLFCLRCCFCSGGLH